MAFISEMRNGSTMRQGWDRRWLAIATLGVATIMNFLVPENLTLPENQSAIEPVRFETLPENDLQKPSRTIFEATSLRPLFTQGRKMRPRLAGQRSPNALDPAGGKFRLLGIAMAPNGRSALIQVGERNDIRTIRMGTRFDDWTVVAIESESVRLSKGQQIVDLRLPKSPLSEEQNVNDASKE